MAAYHCEEVVVDEPPWKQRQSARSVLEILSLDKVRNSNVSKDLIVRFLNVFDEFREWIICHLLKGEAMAFIDTEDVQKGLRAQALPF